MENAWEGARAREKNTGNREQAQPQEVNLGLGPSNFGLGPRRLGGGRGTRGCTGDIDRDKDKDKDKAKHEAKRKTPITSHVNDSSARRQPIDNRLRGFESGV